MEWPPPGVGCARHVHSFVPVNFSGCSGINTWLLASPPCRLAPRRHGSVGSLATPTRWFHASTKPADAFDGARGSIREGHCSEQELVAGI